MLETWLLPLLIGLAAFFHTSVGLAGGSSYTALLAIFGLPVQHIPSISLSLNVLASSTGAVQYIRKQYFDAKILAPFLLGAIPCTFVTAKITPNANLFFPILIAALLISAIKLLCLKQLDLRLRLSEPLKFIIAVAIGALLGALSGLIGIGGGIFLIPILIIFGFASTKKAAACGIVFIWMNSIIGLLSKYLSDLLNIEFILPFFIAALIGAAVGSQLGTSALSAKQSTQILAMILVLASMLLLWRWHGY